MARVNRTSSCGKVLGQLRFCENLSGLREELHFRRQQVIQGFIVDFYCHKVGLVVEVDGDIHDLQQEEDARREKALRELGLRTCVEPVEAWSALGMMRS